MKLKLFAFTLLFCTLFIANAQTKSIEQAKKQLADARTNLQRLDACFRLCDQRLSLNTDTLRKYAFEAKRLSLLTGDALWQAKADYYITNYCIKNGQLDSALLLCDRSLAELQKKQLGGSAVWLQFSALRAQVLVKSNKYKEAIAAFYATLANAEQQTDTLMQMVARNGIGWVNMEMDQNAEALKWLFRALQTTSNPLYHQKNSNIYSNIAAVYTALNKFDSADKYIKRAIQLATADENLFYLSNNLNILADNYIRQNKPALAEAPLQNATKLRELIGDPFYVVSDLSQLALYHAQQKQPDKGIAASLKGIAIARKYRLTSKLPYLQFALAKNYKAAGDYLKYGETMEGVLSLKDSVYQQNSEEELAEIKTRYNQQKQENLIIQQELALNKKNSLIYRVLIVVCFAVAIAVILFNNYKRRQQLIVERLKEEEKRRVEHAVMLAEEAERKRISADLHDSLGAYASAISANVDELFLSDNTPPETVVHNIKSNADGILNSLNETIWVLNKTAIQLTSLCDRFKRYVSRIQDSYPEMVVNINENIRENTVLSPEATLNILRIMQEAFHNAIKHSKGDCITVEITGGPHIEISIADNGKGICNTENQTGNGIANMRKRAKVNGWELTLERGAPKGTVVKLVA